MALELGPFTLLHPIGRGGMGVVWLGRHESQGVPVAVKVITAKVANTEEYHRAFEQEVRAVGALDHPGVVWIFDSGKISAATARESQGELFEGSPYLVMEHASQGTLRQLTRTLSWLEIRAILMTLLDALAHAHARGVLHRDLKPDNILIAGADDLRPGFKITDFGIARPLDDTAIAESKPIGTPQYMAPEQIRNDTERYGPHTDLYAIGTLGWKLVTGKLPYHGMQGAPLMYAQLNKPPPRLVPTSDVPMGIERFLRTMLAKEPHERFQRAADAAVALADLEQEIESGPSFQLEGDAKLDGLDTATLKIVVTQRRANHSQGQTPQPPFPSTWRLPPSASRPLRLMGAGLGLYGMRPVPLVGREGERDMVWKALAQVHLDGKAKVVVIKGPAGVGRTRLLHWISERAHEVGGATILRVSFTAASSAIEQIRRSLVRLLRSYPLPPPLAARFDALFTEQLTGLSGIPIDDAVERLLDPARTDLPDAQRTGMIRRIWELLAVERPLFVMFDDAHWAPDALKLARQLLDTQDSRPSRVLLAVSVLDDVLDRHNEVARLVEVIAERRRARLIELRPFEGEQRVELVQELLGLDIGLAEMVAERTDGNPLFAVQLVGDWVNRRLLSAGPTGFVLTNPDEPLPATLAEVWDGRIRAVAAGLEPPALELLERAAVLGRDVDVLEWQAVCDDPDARHAATGRTYFNPRHARLRHVLMDRLLAQRLAVATEQGFVFTHAQFREALISRATNAGRIRAHATTAAAILTSRRSDGDAERLARLMAEAGKTQGALDALFRAERFRRRTSGAAAALDILDEVERTLKGARIAQSHRGWAELAARRASAYAGCGRYPEALRAAKTAAQLAAGGKWRDLEAQAASLAGQVALRQGDSDSAARHWRSAADLLGSDGDVVETLRVWHRLQRLALQRGDEALALRQAEEVSRAAARAADDREKLAAGAALSEMALRVEGPGALADAERLALEMVVLATRLRDLPADAKIRALLAEIAERRGDLGRARNLWERVIDTLDALGSAPLANLARCRLGLLECRAQQYAAARTAVEGAMAGREPAEPWVRAAIHAVFAVSCAGLGQWERFDTHLTSCESVYPRVTDPDVRYAEVMALAGDLSIRRSQRERAVRAWKLSLARYARLGRPEARELVRKIAALGSPA